MMLDDIEGRPAIAWDELEAERRQLERLSPTWQVSSDRARIESMRATLAMGMRHRLNIEQERIRSAHYRLEALSPLQILKRGYAIVRDLSTGEVVSSIGDAQGDHLLEIRVGDGAFGARVESPLRIKEGLE